MHAISYDAVHDELFVSNPFAQAILAFKGEATGEEKPVRVIQGSRTQLADPQRLDIDGEHNEIFVPDGAGSVRVFPRDGNGDVAPLRSIHSANWRAVDVSVDPVHNLLVVGGAYG